MTQNTSQPQLTNLLDPHPSEPYAYIDGKAFQTKDDYDTFIKESLANNDTIVTGSINNATRPERVEKYVAETLDSYLDDALQYTARDVASQHLTKAEAIEAIRLWVNRLDDDYVIEDFENHC